MPNVKNPNDLNEDFHDNVGKGKMYDNYKPSSIPSRRYEEVIVSKDKKTIKLIDKNQKDTISLIQGEFVEYHGKEYFEIRYTWSKYKKRGDLTYLFEILIYDMNLIVLSDGNHTSPGSKEFWNAHIKKNKFEIFRYDIETNYKRNAKKYKEEEIWGLTSKELKKLEEQKKKFEIFNLLDDIIFEDIFEENQEISVELNSEEDELISQFEYEIVEAPQIKEYKSFVANYRELIKSKEKIRLIAQKIRKTNHVD
jgi:hypothetical protein